MGACEGDDKGRQEKAWHLRRATKRVRKPLPAPKRACAGGPGAFLFGARKRRGVDLPVAGVKVLKRACVCAGAKEQKTHRMRNLKKSRQ